MCVAKLAAGLVHIAVGESVFVTSAETLMGRDGGSLLAETVAQWVAKEDGVPAPGCRLSYPDRDPSVFLQVLNYLRTGRLLRSTKKELPALVQLLADARYYRLPGLIALLNHSLSQWDAKHRQRLPTKTAQPLLADTPACLPLDNTTNHPHAGRNGRLKPQGHASLPPCSSEEWGTDRRGSASAPAAQSVLGDEMFALEL